MNYRILYFLHGRTTAILADALVKEDVMPRSNLLRAIERKRRFLQDPEKHIYSWISLVDKTRDATRIVDRMIGEDEELRQLIVAETLNAEVARLIHEARTEAGLTQAALAERIGTTQPVIARLEDADYEGHSLSMLQRIAIALGQRLKLQFVPLGGALEAP